MIVTLVGLVILAAVLGAPLFIVISAISMVGFYMADIELSVITIELYRLANTPILLALPLFTVSGFLLSESNTSERLVRLTRAFLGWMPGGLAVVAFVVCAFFTAFTGASGVTIVALGALLYPALKKDGYQERFSLGLVTVSGSLGLLLPPSLPLIIYGIVAQQMDVGSSVTIENLFIAGIIPAFLMIVLLALWSLWANRKAGIPLTSFSLHEALSALNDAKWELPLPFIILGGIYSGFFAVSEAAAITAIYVLIVEVFIYREIKRVKLPLILRDSMVMVGGILMILGVSLSLTNYLIDAEVPAKLFILIQTYISSKFVFLILLNVLLMILGTMLDIFSALIIMVPLILPVAVSYGVDPVHLGVIFLANMQIGYFTPPVGMNLFIASYRFKKPVLEICWSTLPFMLILLFVVLIITYFPILSLFFIR